MKPTNLVVECITKANNLAALFMKNEEHKMRTWEEFKMRILQEEWMTPTDALIETLQATIDEWQATALETNGTHEGELK